MSKTTGAAFLIQPSDAEEIFTPEDFTEEHEAIAETTIEFFNNEVAPEVPAMLGDPTKAVPLLRKSGDIGLLGVVVPERYGGMELDLTSAMIVAECLARDASYSVWHSAHSGIGTLPTLLFGTEDQKERYLPRLVSGEMIAAYCLSEPQSGSDALNVKTKATLSADGSHYVLNGQKMWASNGGGSGLFTIFAKVDGEKFTAFLVEGSTEGLSVGAEEKKMGIKGSSTCAVFLDNLKVPVENVLGEVGRGHVIAFNCLNLGRLKLGPGCVGGSKNALKLAIGYAKERHAFGKPIGEFGLIRQKLAEMAIRIFAAETLTYRVSGMVEAHLQEVDWNQPDAAKLHLAAFEEFATECAMVKVYTTETLDYVVDEAVQIHGGYGFHQDYEVERAYRDSRINRIFEGTNEINRLLATGMMIKRAQRGRLPLVEAVKSVQQELLSATGPQTVLDDPLDEAARLADNVRKLALLALGTAYQRFNVELEEQQEVLAGITDIAMQALLMESVTLRSRKLATTGKGDFATDMCSVFVRQSMERVEPIARAVLAACSEGDTLRSNLAVLRRFTKFEPVDAFSIRRRLAARLLESGRYLV